MIYILAGTPYDSRKGADFLNTRGIQAIPVPVSRTPAQQAHLHSQPDKLTERIRELLSRLPPAPVAVYCNSLSLSLPFQDFLPPDFTPCFELQSILFGIASSASLRHKKIGIIVADTVTLRRVKNLFAQSRFPGQITGIADLALVQLYEQDPAAAKARLLSHLTSLSHESIDSVILSCTHFDDPSLQQLCPIKIIQPGLILLQAILNRLRIPQPAKPTSIALR
jgi:glutamate racemase